MENSAIIQKSIQTNLSQKSEMKIGNTTYIINTHYNEFGKETAKDKLLKFVSSCISFELKK